jgi:CBS domain-containing protein
MVSTVMTCGPNDLIGNVAPRAESNWCVVVNEHRIVLGRLGPKELASPPGIAVDVVMQPGPATVRANEPLDALLSRMAQHHVPLIVVTTPEGRLLGVVLGADTNDRE